MRKALYGAALVALLGLNVWTGRGQETVVPSTAFTRGVLRAPDAATFRARSYGRYPLLSAEGGGTNFYAGPGGSASNNGLSTNTPWPIDYAVAHAGPSNTIWLLSGAYTTNIEMYVPSGTRGLTVRALTKWGPVFQNITNNNGVFTCDLGRDCSGFTIDGVAFSNCLELAVMFRDNSSSNMTMRNCWVQKTGMYGWVTNHSQSAMQTYPAFGVLVEDDLLESNGIWAPGYNHGIYGGGTNGVYRNNVCRYNGGYGININGHGENCPNNWIYNNLVYSNFASTSGQQVGVYNDSGSSHVSNYTNYLFGNTVISYGNYALRLGDGIFVLTNNILLSTNALGITRDYTNDIIYGSANLAQAQIQYGVGTIIMSPAGFVNSSKGQYWLLPNSPARNAALGTGCGPVDFFGVARSLVDDIGAFQYDPVYAGDARVLDPSPAGGADYWFR